MSEQYIEGGYIAVGREDMEELVHNQPGMYLKIFLILAHRSNNPGIVDIKNNQLFTTIEDILVDASWKEKKKTRYPSKQEVYDALYWLKDFNLIHFDEIKDSGFLVEIVNATVK